MAKINRVKKDKKGTITGVSLTNGQKLTKNQAVKQAENGNIEGVHAVHPEGGASYIRSNNDDKKKNNLGNLPEY